ncbi:Ig-like domain-containing protein [Actinoplanes sp. NPDC023714]|uniref:Ig-like domain-containing protein n=1 Tax=Actinoplanes sp. NPDC023714 TaxID=3154322 RepID=UPI0033D72D51
MRGRCAGILLLVLAVMLTTVPPARVAAAITSPFTTRFDVNANGAILLRGNANLTCPVTLLTPTCANARNGVGSTTGEELNDNGYPMAFTDADGDPATFNDSTAAIGMPAGSTVLFAGLYWGADPSAGSAVGSLLGAAAPAPADKNKVLFRTPAGSTWNPITATSVYTISASGPYQGFADVTALVAGAGNGVYSVANIQSGRGADRYAGWTLVIAYANPAEDMRSLRVYDGFGSIASGSVSIPVTGFETPHSGTVRAEVGAVAYEGDLGKTGDALKLNGQTLSDAANPAANAFNSTVSEGGSIVGGRTPNHRNLFGVDIDRFDASGVLGNAATSATLTMTTNGETYYPGVITIAIDLYAPKIVTTMTATDVNGGALVPGDEIEYRIAVRNDGRDIADGVTLTDPIPVWTTYVPSSLRIEGVPVTDAADGDGGETGAGTAVFRLGSIPYQGTTYVTFRVRVDAGVPAGHAVANLVNVGYTGRTTSVAVASAGAASATPVLQPEANLSATLTVAPPYVRRADLPENVVWTGIVRNAGPDLEPAAVAELTLPAGLTAGTLPAGCTPAGQVITCALGPLLPGHLASVTIPAVADVSTASSASASLTAEGSGRDAAAGDDTATVALVVSTPPVAADDSATTTHASPVSIDVLANDTGAGTTAIVAMPAHGAAVVEADDTITYTPVPGWAGVDTFTYEAGDAYGGTDIATVTVTTANAPPIANDDERNAPPATAVSVAVLANDTDPNNDLLTVIGFGQPQSGAGTVTQLGPLLFYTPDPSFSGRADFTYTIQDSRGGQATGTVHVNVENAAPTAADDAYTTPFQTTALIDVLANDTDPNLIDTKAVDAVDPPATVVGGLVRYQPPAGFSGTVTFSYTMRDSGGLTSSATVTVTVLNDPPVAADLAVGLAYGQSDDVDVLSHATDANVPADTLRVSGATNPAHGSTVVRPDGTIRYTPDTAFSGTDHFDYTVDDGHGGSDTGRVTVTVANGLPVARADAITVQAGIPRVIDVMANDDGDPNGDPLTLTVTGSPAHGTAVIGPGNAITYTPGAGYRGADSFGYTLSDGLGSSTATVTIGVVNSAPTARADAISTDTDTAVTVDPLANDDDPNGDAVTLAGTTAAAHGTVVRNADDTLTYTPAAGFYGTDTLGYTVEDPERLTGSAVVTITVRNAAPIAADDFFVAHPQVTTVLDVLANDHDPNTGQALSVASAGAAGKGAVVLRTDGTLTYRSAPGSTGQDTFAYQVTDDLGRTDDGLVTITINGPPVAAPDAASTASATAVTIPVTANDTDPESDALTVVSVSTPAHGAAAIDGPGTVRYAPHPSFAGTELFAYVVRDSAGNTATGSISVLVAPVPPIVVPPPPAVTTPPAPASPTVSPTPSRPASPTASPTVSPTFSATASPTLSPTLSPTVSPTRSAAPPVVPDRAAITKPGERVAVPLPRTDHQGRPVTVTAVGTPQHGTAVLNADGTVTYTPDPGFTGTDTFTYTVVDANGNVARATVVIRVGDEQSPGPAEGSPLPATGTGAAAVARFGAAVVLAGAGLYLAFRPRSRS